LRVVRAVDIVFFHEPLDDAFFDYLQDDIKKCDLLLVMGSSLKGTRGHRYQRAESMIDHGDGWC